LPISRRDPDELRRSHCPDRIEKLPLPPFTDYSFGLHADDRVTAFSSWNQPSTQPSVFPADKRHRIEGASPSDICYPPYYTRVEFWTCFRQREIISTQRFPSGEQV